MKKFFTLVVTLLMITTFAYSQVIFSEDFDDIAGPTNGGLGSYTFPAGWKLVNVDAKTPDASVSYMTNAWIRFDDEVDDTCAISTSYYAPAGASNDWMWTPAIDLPAGSRYKLTWRAKAFDVSFPDGYEVRVMTVAPTGTTGNIGNMISNSTTLLSIAEEEPEWTNRTVILDAALSGQTIYIGYRNNATDQFILAVDDVQVEVMFDFDAAITKSKSLEYTFVPLSQAVPVSLGATVANEGLQSMINVNVKAEVYNQANNMVFSANGTTIGSIAVNASHDFTINGWTPADTGVYFVKYFPTQRSNDQKVSNDTFFDFIVITDTVYGRDNADVDGSLGLGSGNGYLGTSYTINQPGKLTSVSMFFTRGFTGRRYAAVVWNTLPNGTPNTIVGFTDTLLYPNNNSLFTTIKLKGGPLDLTPGKYVITAIEFDSTIRLATTSGIATNGTLWAKIASDPWRNVESLLVGYNKTFVIRMNLADPSTLPVKLTSIRAFDEGRNVRVEWKVQNESNMKEYEVEKSADARTFTSIDKVAAKNRDAFTYYITDASPIKGNNYYRIKSIEGNGTYTYSPIVKVNRGSGKSNINVYPNPVKNNNISINLSNLAAGNYTLTMFNAAGQRVLNRIIPHGGGSATQTMQLNNQPKGVYHVLITDGQNSYKQSIIVE